MPTLPVMIAQLPAYDLERAGAVLDVAFDRRGMLGSLRLAYALQPESWFCARDGEQIVGVVGAYDYGPMASIGMMAVVPSVQRRGMGEKLLTELVAYLDRRGCPLLFLDASAAGQQLYPKLGFVPEGETLRLRRISASLRTLERANGLDETARGEEGREAFRVSRLEQRDLADVAAFDAPIFGADRRVVISSFWSGSPDRSLVARDSADRVAGYLIAGGNHIGPWVSATPSAAAVLLSAALALPFGDPPFLTCPGANLAGLSLLARHGFVVTERLLHMRRGGQGDPRQVAFLYSQASLTLG